MKKNSFTRSAFFNRRMLLAFSLLLGVFGVALAVFAFGAGSKPISSTARGGGAGPFFKSLGEPLPEATQANANVPYRGPHNDTRPVHPIRTIPLRQMQAIPPALAPARFEWEPPRTKPPTDASKIRGTGQTYSGSPLSAPTAGLIFDGIGTTLGGFVPGSNPPDTNGRVGATQYVQWNNTSFAVFNKTTGALLYGPAAGNTLFQSLGGVCASHYDGDPVVSYEIRAGRWVISQFAVAGGDTSFSHQCIAVSTTEDATGEYYLYDFLTDATNFVDYPHTGVWPDGYYMSAHVFSVVPTDASPVGLPVAPPNAFITGRIYVFERDKMINGLPARMQSVDLAQQYGLLPADLDSLTPPPAGEAEFVLAPDVGFYDRTDPTRVQVTWNPVATIAALPGAFINFGVGNAPCVNGQQSPARDCVPQPPPAVGLDYLDNISGHLMYRLAYRNIGTQALPDERLVVSGPSAGSDSNHGAVEWFEFRNAGSSTTQPTLFQSGTYDPDTSYRWLPSIAMDKDGNIALGYSKSSTTIKPGIYLTGRLATDPGGTMGAETEMQAGLGVQQGAGNRWGDYSSMTLDPIDQCTFYYTNEYLKTNGGFNWSTRIAAFKFPSCTSAANLYGTVTGTITSSETGAPISGVRVALSNGYAGASDANGVYTIIVPAGSNIATAA